MRTYNFLLTGIIKLMTTSVRHELINIRARSTAASKAMSYEIDNTFEIPLSASLIDNMHDGRNNHFMERILGAEVHTQVNIIREMMTRDVIQITPSDAPFVRVENVRCVGRGKVELCGDERVVPVPVFVQTDPATELGTVSAASIGWTAVALRVCNPDLGEVLGVEF